MDLSSITDPLKTELLLCFCDIQNFRRIAEEKPDPMEIFRLLDGMAKLVIDQVEKAGGIVVKFIGDESFIVFPPEKADEGMNALLALKTGVEKYFGKQKCAMKMRFCVHYGEAVIGAFGSGRNRTVDAVGDHVNLAASLARGEHRGRFIISAQAFRKLLPATRRKFHKFTPPIVYLAED
jgi:adenylate cyclase